MGKRAWLVVGIVAGVLALGCVGIVAAGAVLYAIAPPASSASAEAPKQQALAAASPSASPSAGPGTASPTAKPASTAASAGRPSLADCPLCHTSTTGSMSGTFEVNGTRVGSSIVAGVYATPGPVGSGGLGCRWDVSSDALDETVLRTGTVTGYTEVTVGPRPGGRPEWFSTYGCQTWHRVAELPAGWVDK